MEGSIHGLISGTIAAFSAETEENCDERQSG